MQELPEKSGGVRNKVKNQKLPAWVMMTPYTEMKNANRCFFIVHVPSHLSGVIQRNWCPFEIYIIKVLDSGHDSQRCHFETDFHFVIFS